MIESNLADYSVTLDWYGEKNVSSELPLSSDNEYSSGDNQFIPSPMFQTIIYIFYSVIFIMAFVGNTVVCTVVFSSIRQWTVTNFFIANMAVGDILIAFFCIPFSSVSTFLLLYWPFGSIMCRIVSFSQAVSVFVSAYTMVAISCDKYLAIVYPLRPRMTRKHCKVIITMIWLMATLTALPILVMSDLFIPELSSWHQNGGHYVCQERWSDPSQQTLYTTILLLLQFCFPLAIISFNYGCIFIEIWSKKVPGEANQDRDLRLARSKQKIIKMMMVVVVCFVICWLPYNMIQMIGDKYPEMWDWGKINYVMFACHWLAMSHSAYNPVIYYCFSSKFRQGFKTVAERCGCVRPAVNNDDNTDDTNARQNRTSQFQRRDDQCSLHEL